MDPQKLSQLDPKLRDAYQRVMGTPLPQVQPASPRGEPVQAQTPLMPTPPTPTPSIPDPTPAPQPAPQPEPTPPPAGGPTPTIEEPGAPPQPPEYQPPVPEPTTPEPPPAIPAPEPAPTPEPAIPQQPPLGTNNFVQMNSEVASAPTVAPPASPNFAAPATASTIAVKKKSMMMPVMIGAAALVFLAIYTLFWTKLFSLKVPFLP